MITVIDYGLGNLASVVNALEKIETPYEVSSSPLMVKQAERLILPGVGAAGQGMNNLKKFNLDKAIIEEVKNGKPILGICLGMQLLFEQSEEGNVSCLGLFKGKVKKFIKERKVPQIGWNNVKFLTSNQEGKSLYKDIPNFSFFYFVNSYYCQPERPSIIAGESNYGEKFASVVVKNNIIGTQFHPEKSGKVGFKLLENFAKRIIC